jgi:DNA-binding transcriptional LysR family regulator
MLDKLSEMRAFQAVADAGSFTAAAANLRLSQSLMSRAVASLERRLGTTLLHRSTRRVSLTDEGVVFLQGCRRVLEDIGEVERSIMSGDSPTGTLRISASVLFGQDRVVPLVPEFMARYPKLQVNLSLEDRHIDLIEEKIDVAIRLGRLPSSSLIARKLGEQRRIIVAAPAYLARHGRPNRPNDLLAHNCILWDQAHDDLNRWPVAVSSTIRHTRVRGAVVVNNAQALLQLAMLGAGITRISEYLARPLIRRGELVPLLEKWHRDAVTPVHALYARSSAAKPKVRALVDFLVSKLGETNPKVA